MSMISSRPGARRRPLISLAGTIRGWIVAARERRRFRRELLHLRRLSPHLRRDIGLEDHPAAHDRAPSHHWR